MEKYNHHDTLKMNKTSAGFTNTSKSKKSECFQAKAFFMSTFV